MLKFLQEIDIKSNYYVWSLVRVDLAAEKGNHVLKLRFVVLIGGDEVFMGFEDFPCLGDFLIVELGKFGVSVAITAQIAVYGKEGIEAEVVEQLADV